MSDSAAVKRGGEPDLLGLTASELNRDVASPYNRIIMFPGLVPHLPTDDRQRFNNAGAYWRGPFLLYVWCLVKKQQRHLTPEQVWAILNEPETDVADLARRIGATENAVKLSRRRHRKKPWACTVRFAICPSCQRPVTLRSNSPVYKYHPGCAQRAKVERLRAKVEATPGATDQQLRRLKSWQLRKQEETQAQARHSGQLWTEEDDAVLIALLDHPVEVTCRALGRSLHAVNHRRIRLEKRGLLSLEHHRRRNTTVTG